MSRRTQIPSVDGQWSGLRTDGSDRIQAGAIYTNGKGPNRSERWSNVQFGGNSDVHAGNNIFNGSGEINDVQVYLGFMDGDTFPFGQGGASNNIFQHDSSPDGDSDKQDIWRALTAPNRPNHGPTERTPAPTDSGLAEPRP